MPYKDPEAKRAHNARYRAENPERVARWDAASYEQKKKHRANLKAAGLCGDCGARPLSPRSKRRCERCLTHDAMYHRNRANAKDQKIIDELIEQFPDLAWIVTNQTIGVDVSG